MKIAVIPIDNRPICYDLISDILKIDNNCEVYLPNISSLGGLLSHSNVDEIFEFIENLPNVDYLIVSLDTLAYGGLVSSRRCEDEFERIKKRIEKFKNLASKKAKKILAFSSVMRISNNNINEEEKIYWKDWGKKIFDWSFEFNKTKKEPKTDIPKEILEDYLKTRERNFEINKIYLSWAKEGFFDTLIFSKDDCAEFGLNVKEARELEKIIEKENIKNAKIKTGADEIPLSLISRAYLDNEEIKIKPVFAFENSKNLISKYEDISIFSCANAQLELAKAKTEEKNADIILYINNFKKEQGDLVLGDVINQNDFSKIKNFDFAKEKFFIADTNNANGADKKLIEKLFKEGNLENFYGYCGYNTSANTLGCAILIAIVKFISLKNKTYNDNAFKKVCFVRFLDDWGYQAISRKYVRNSAPNFEEALREKTKELDLNSKKIEEFLQFKPKKASYSLPWNRSFEIRIELN